MGGGSFDPDSYRTYSHSVADKSHDEIYTSAKLDPSLDPKGVKFRESRDSADNPESTPVIVALDVTASMGDIAAQIAKKGLGTLFEGILKRRPVTDPHLMFMGIGDAACDSSPLQVSQFEADNRIVTQLTNLFLEGGGGGNSHESYDLAWLFAGRHTKHDSMEKRGKRGYLFTIGDEQTPRKISKDALKSIFGIDAQAGAFALRSLEEAQRLYDVYHVTIEEGFHATHYPAEVRSAWTDMLGQKAIFLKDYRLLAETIVSAIQVAEGTDHDTASSGWGSASKGVIGDAVANLPQGGRAPKRLGA